MELIGIVVFWLLWCRSYGAYRYCSFFGYCGVAPMELIGIVFFGYCGVAPMELIVIVVFLVIVVSLLWSLSVS
jgi:hypothetical protein